MTITSFHIFLNIFDFIIATSWVIKLSPATASSQCIIIFFLVPLSWGNQQCLRASHKSQICNLTNNLRKTLNGTPDSKNLYDQPSKPNAKPQNTTTNHCRNLYQPPLSHTTNKSHNKTLTTHFMPPPQKTHYKFESTNQKVRDHKLQIKLNFFATTNQINHNEGTMFVQLLYFRTTTKPN